MNERQALCIKCQACCKELLFRIAPDAENTEFYKARGLKILLHPAGQLFVAVPHVCAQLTKNGCKIYAKRPLACQVFDGRTNILTKDVCLWKGEEK